MRKSHNSLFAAAVLNEKKKTTLPHHTKKALRPVTDDLTTSRTYHSNVDGLEVAEPIHVESIVLRGGIITLGQLMKLIGVIGTGGHARTMLESEPALVNGQSESRRGRKLYPGDEVVMAGWTLNLIAESGKEIKNQ